MAAKGFVIQWHLLTDCEFSCTYCYLNNFQIEKHSDFQIILNSIKLFKKNHKKISVNLTGGNPFLHPHINTIIRDLFLSGIKVNILGNPIDEDIATKLNTISHYINSYQLSFDGSEGHLRNRKTNNLKDIWHSVDILNKMGIKSNIMFTLTNNNKNEIVDAIKLSCSKSINYFSFSRMIPINKYQIKNIISPVEMNSILNSIFFYLTENNIFNFDFKENLWKLFFFEKGFYKPKKRQISGCGIGHTSLAIMPDGSVYPCSRLPIKLDNLNNKTLNDIFNNNGLLKQFKDPRNFLKCRNCELMNVCRGCPAISYALTKDCFNADPQCWKTN